MKKFIRVIEIILIVFAVLCGIALCIGYIWFRENTIQILNSIKDFVNQPLPIVGVSIVGIGLFVYEIVVRTNYGRKALNRVEETAQTNYKRLEEKEIELEQVKKDVEEELKAQGVDIKELKEYLIELCGYSRNIKAHELANKIGGVDNGEEINSETPKE